MRRGEIWTQSGGPGYAGKPRPALILQSDLLVETDSVITCLFTSHKNDEIPSRITFVPNTNNGLRESCDLMIEKITAVPRSKLGQRLGFVATEDMDRVEDAMLLVLGFAG